MVREMENLRPSRGPGCEEGRWSGSHLRCSSEVSADGFLGRQASFG